MRRALAALALVTAGFAAAFALAGSSTSTADDPVALLDQSYAKFQSASLYRKWKQQNPGEATLVESFWANGGTAPTVATAPTWSQGRTRPCSPPACLPPTRAPTWSQGTPPR